MADEEPLNKVAAAADTNDTDPAGEWVAHRRPAKDPSMVYTVRIPASRVEQLRELAEARGLAPRHCCAAGSSPNSTQPTKLATATTNAGNATFEPPPTTSALSSTNDHQPPDQRCNKGSAVRVRRSVA